MQTIEIYFKNKKTTKQNQKKTNPKKPHNQKGEDQGKVLLEIYSKSEYFSPFSPFS